MKKTCDADLVVPVSERRTLITVQQEVKTPDGSGGYSNTWTTVSTAWVLAEQKSGWEPFKHQAVTTEETWKFSGVYADLALVKTTDRLIIDGVVYNIKDVDDLKRRHITIVITAQEGVTQ